jgi:hypothetical protein
MKQGWFLLVASTLVLAGCGVKVPVGNVDLEMSKGSNGMAGTVGDGGTVEGQGRGSPISLASVPVGNTEVTGGSWTAGISVSPTAGAMAAAIGVEPTGPVVVELKNFGLKVRFFKASLLGGAQEPTNCNNVGTNDIVLTAVTSLNASATVALVGGKYKIAKSDGVIKDTNVSSMNTTVNQFVVMAKDTVTKWAFVSCITGTVMIDGKVAPKGSTVLVDDFKISAAIKAGL